MVSNISLQGIGPAPDARRPLPETRADSAGLFSFAKRVLDERNLYGALAFAETAESLSLAARALDVGPNDRVAGITSSGDMLLSFLARGPEAVVGFDANPTQTALAHLKLAAIRHLEVGPYLELMGVAEDDPSHRVETFDRVSRAMPARDRSVALRRRGWVGGGILNRGMTHLIIRAMVRSFARLVDDATVELFLGDGGSDEERAACLDAVLARRRVRLGLAPLLRTFAPQLKWLFFPHRICRVSARPDEMIAAFFDTFRPLFVRGAKNNPVLCRSATGELHREWKAHLYDEELFARIRDAADRVRFVSEEITAGLASLPEGWATKIYLSNVPDYLEPDGLDALIDALHRVAADGARVLYFSLCDEDRLGERLGPRAPESVAGALHAADNVHLYPSIEVRRIAW